MGNFARKLFFFTLSGAFLFLIFPTISIADEDDESISACRSMKKAQRELDTVEKILSTSKTPEKKDDAEEKKIRAQRDFDNSSEKCEREKEKINKKKAECDKRNELIQRTARESGQDTSPKDVFHWKDGECVATKKTPSVNDADCGNASLFEGGLKGEACKKTATTVNDVQSRNKSVTETTNATASAFAQVTAMRSTGQQQDAQKSQQRIMQGIALAKMASSLSQLSGAAQLKSAAGEAEEANNKMTKAHKAIKVECDTNSALFKGNSEDCFYAIAGKYGVPATKVEYTNHERLLSGASQSQDQADRANNLAKSSTITGLADAMTGLQAWQASRMAAKNATGLNTLPPPTFILNNGTGASAQPGIGGISNPASPHDYGNGDGSGATLGDVGGSRGDGGIMPGRYFGANGSAPAKSTVSAGGGGGGGLGGGRGGGGGASGRSKSKSSGGTGVGEYNIAGGGMASPHGSGGSKEAEPANNPFADALAKLFPTDKEGKPIVDGRAIASDPSGEQNANGEESMVFSEDLTIFQRISSKLRQLNSYGSI